MREAEVNFGQGKTVKEASRLLEINEQIYFPREQVHTLGSGLQAVMSPFRLR
jgi:hypothetical protein